MQEFLEKLSEKNLNAIFSFASFLAAKTKDTYAAAASIILPICWPDHKQQLVTRCEIIPSSTWEAGMRGSDKVVAVISQGVPPGSRTVALRMSRLDH